MKTAKFGFVGVVVSLLASSASAHHSFAMFDADKKVTLEGTIKEFRWTNPHSWILMIVPNAEGQPEQWAIEMGAPSGLARQGWVPKTLIPGMKVSAVIHPLKDGSTGGQFVSVTLPDGKILGAGGIKAGGGTD